MWLGHEPTVREEHKEWMSGGGNWWLVATLVKNDSVVVGPKAGLG